MNLEEKFIEYRDVTVSIIDMIKAEEYEKLEGVFQERQVILDNIVEKKYSKEELKKYYIKYDIDKLEKILALDMNERKYELLMKIKESQKRKVAMSGYNNLQARAVFLSREF